MVVVGIICFIVGTFIGMMLLALVSAGKHNVPDGIQYWIAEVRPKRVIEETQECHDVMEKTAVIPLELSVNKSGWIAVYQPDDMFTPWHRIKTSIIQKVVYDSDIIYVETENTNYTFKRAAVLTDL